MKSAQRKTQVTTLAPTRTNQTLKSKITSVIIGVIVFFGLTASLFVFVYSRNILIKNETENIEQATQEMIHELEGQFVHAETLVETISKQQIVINTFIAEKPDAESISKYLEQFNIGNWYSSIYLMDKEGLTIAATDRDFIGKNYGFRDYFIDAMKEGAGMDVVLGVTSKKLGFYFAHAVYDAQGNVVGTTIIKMKPDIIKENLMRDAKEFEKSVMLSDEYGVVIASSKKDRLYKSFGQLEESQLKEIEEKKRFGGIEIQPLQYAPLQERITASETDLVTIDYNDVVDGELETLSLGKVSKYPFYLSLEEEQSEYTKSALTIAGIISGFVILAAITATILISIRIGKLLKPLEQLIEATDKISKGNLDIKVTLNTKDELEELGNAFNNMAKKLKKEKKEIEGKIQERTKELERLNESMTGRELKMIELKKEIEKLRKEKI